MPRHRIASVGVSFCLAVVLTAPDTGFAQSGADNRRPPRLTGTPEGSTDPGGPSRRRLAPPYTYFDPYLVASDDYVYPDDSAETETPRDIYPVFDTVRVVHQENAVSRVGAGPADTLLVEQISSKGLVRLTWRDPGFAATQVAFFLADSSQRVLSAQTVRSPPFTALFEPPPGTAFAGTTVVLRDGALVTRFVRYRGRAR